MTAQPVPQPQTDFVPAPYFAEIARGPTGGETHWLTTKDGLRIRAGHWPAPGEARGSILLFPGRTEYIEKYGPTACDLVAEGFSVLAVDWRGQGLADRALAERRLGHVGDFAEFQLDVAAVLEHAEALDLPKPWFMIAHSMGGAIGLRALMNGAPVAAAAFTAPMWGIRIPLALRPVARILSQVGPHLGLSEKQVPTTTIEQYVQVAPFEGNTLTNDPETYAFLQMQMAAQPDLVLGGPTLQWLASAMSECAAPPALPSPQPPCLPFLGESEQIVAPPPIHDRMSRWPGGRLEMVPDAQHEILMERPETRARTIAAINEFFRTHSAG
ncbi:alpha/beta hydrolase [Phaeobacter sp. HF9A]|uniref:alpha/beta hydrolase n=1 Tax=Phaeobacter sp. HF9A TaxID=2721561 RepID=UPI001431AF8B|nr:alpha/beta hydrolase [Phaeobacter sp. HF9A]NIZ15183.1 alpha/beta hydrolase [Phaeobacter sp. HF9A]